MIKKIKLFTLRLTRAIYSFPLLLATSDDTDFQSFRPTSIGEISIADVLDRMIDIIWGIVGLIAVIYLIYGGFLYMTSGGSEEQVGKAKNVMMYAFIGIIIIALSYAIVNFVMGKLFGTEFTGIQVPGSPGS